MRKRSAFPIGKFSTGLMTELKDFESLIFSLLPHDPPISATVLLGWDPNP